MYFQYNYTEFHPIFIVFFEKICYNDKVEGKFALVLGVKREKGNG